MCVMSAWKEESGRKIWTYIEESDHHLQPPNTRPHDPITTKN